MTIQDFANIATIGAFFGVIFAAYQIKIAREQMVADHERSRREKSVEMLLEWTRSINEHGSLARKIVENLTADECRNLHNLKQVKIPASFKVSMETVLGVPLVETNGFIEISDGNVSKLRWLVMSYLNLLESILVAWQYSIVDRDIIEHQFSYLFAPEHGHYALENFRVAAGGEKTYPATAIFANHIEQKRKQILTQKANVA